MITEAIILAGGLGTRLRSAVPDLPKCMAPVAGKPFLYYLIEQCKKEGVRSFIFCLGYMHEAIEKYLQTTYKDLNYQISLESEPLGTGGAVLKASGVAADKHCFVLNGDTFFGASLGDSATFHIQCVAECSLTLKPMANSDRYGVVEINAEGKVTGFREKKWYAESLINGGVYVLDLKKFRAHLWPEKFSFEKDYLESKFSTSEFYGLVQEKYFIDIGIPEDLERAQIELPSHYD